MAKKTVDTSMIKYEEELVTVKNGGQPVARKIVKTPYLEHNGYKVYLSQTEMLQIEAGKLNPETILKNITEEIAYKHWL